MSESEKPRAAIDQTQIDRQLVQARPPRVHPPPPTRGDPPAELARIVAQDDPFPSILANDGSARPRQQTASVDDLSAVRDTMTPAARVVPVRAPQAGHSAPAY